MRPGSAPGPLPGSSALLDTPRRQPSEMTEPPQHNKYIICAKMYQTIFFNENRIFSVILINLQLPGEVVFAAVLVDGKANWSNYNLCKSVFVLPCETV